ncbi:right-handed parallel beta-helix repeat-containing protein [Arenibaculum pallidiluteum]|uniref:right-handed parallel beta-helix repeat-containing protein n=1 Tax=Arenibaculum pallidiluteum TaxID=2812559 RepID=UPI001A96E9FD|nr:right-handed parallel beta-helix repeat-containing protein [Arenibaculum pallidiluteum]
MAYDPLSISPVANAYIPFENAKPTKYLWVSPNGSNSNSGSQGSPLKTIQAAVNKATPGTAIMVKAGTYKESVQLTKDGTTDKPIWLTSADGIGAAKIVSSSTSNGPIYAHGEDNWIIKGFETQGGKNGIQFSMSGSDIRKMGAQGMTKNVVIQDNIIKNVKIDDGIKLSQAQNFVVVGNTIEGGVGEEGLDNVYTTNSVFAYNTFKNLNGLSAITVKGASENISIHHNYIKGMKTDGILIGGWSTNTGALFPKTGFEAKNIKVESNEILDVGKRAINVLSGWDSQVKNNYLNPKGSYESHAHVDKDNSGWISKNVHFSGNITGGGDWLTIAGGSKNITQSGNSASGSWSVKTGAANQPGKASPAAAPSEAMPTEAKPSEAPSSEAPVSGSWKASAAWTKTLYGSNTQGKADTLTGTSAKEYLDGRSGNDTMTGGGGDDTYAIGAPGDKVVEKAGGGTDTALLWGNSWKMASHVENLEIRQTSGKPVVTDNDLDNLLTAQARTADLFKFVKENGHDLIKGFVVGQDHIDLDASVASSAVKVFFKDGSMVLDLPGDNSITLAGVGNGVTLDDVLA